MRPQWHYRPERNWINDPNGLVHLDGWYHMFYQYNPNGDQWGDIHWGHARSRDLLHWETLPVALSPVRDKGELHCFSGGCCKDEAGRPHFFYTSIGSEVDGRDCAHGAQQWYAEPAEDSLLTLIQTDENALLDSIHPGFHVRDWRDPCVLRHGGQYLMVLGGCVDERGCVLLYTSPDMRHWSFRHILAQSDKADGVPWECPNLISVGEKCVLFYSPCAAVRAKIGTLDAELRFLEEADELVEPERNGFYAPQAFKDEAGRVILIGWMPEADNVPHKGWSGVMSLPRILSVTEDGLCMAPILGAEKLSGVQRMRVLREALPMTWTLYDNGRERTLLTLTEDGILTLDRSASTLEESPDKHPIVRQVPLKVENDLFIAVDGSAVEVMVNGKWLSGRIYPTGGALRFVLPEEQHLPDVLAFYAEMEAQGTPCIGWQHRCDYAAWLREMQNRRNGENLPDGYVRENFYLCYDGAELVGVYSLKFELTEYLLNYGGYVGYAVRPSRQGQGLATRMLRQGLQIAKEKGFDRLLLVCDEDNPASERVILKCGGVYEDSRYDAADGSRVKRYWVGCK